MKTKKEQHSIANQECRIPLLSFFTGGGFLDMGFEQAGFEIAWTNEVSPVFSKMYNYGMTMWRRALGIFPEEVTISCKESIENLLPNEILSQAFNRKLPRIFGIVGGPPCPDFSAGGKNQGGVGINGHLSETFINCICNINPSFFVFENVSGLFRIKKHRDFLNSLERKLELSGYCVDLKLLNALEFGVPQNRERLIMIGIKNSIVQSCLGRTIKNNERGWFYWPKPKYKDAQKGYPWPSITKKGSQIILPFTIPPELTVYSVLKSLNDHAELPNVRDCFRAYSNKFKTIKEGDTNRKSFKRLHRFRFSPTVCYGHNEVHLHPWLPRRLNLREVMRIQGIPDTYVLPGGFSLTAKFAMVSNGVPVPLAYEVARSLNHFVK